MNYLKEKILKDGKTGKGGILRVDSFLNHQIDLKCLEEIGKEFKRRFSDTEVTKILTVEASGIAVAVVASRYFDNIPVIFAKKMKSANMDAETYEAKVYSYTKNREYTVRVSKNYLNENDKVLIIDDFLAHGSAITGLLKIVEQSKAKVSGVGIVIEKSFQNGGKNLREKEIKLESLVKIKFDENNNVKFDN